MEEKKTVIIFTAKKARKLLKEGLTLVDIKTESVFVFKNEDGILENM